ncbi:ABC transporter permease [Mesorhizobium sp.]|uniref:ABC transporter permease n=2 Tax=Mesorhizobium sp. TaxID=1871066 RepID=UPI000FE8D19D|nr:ABC transporter permease [Mesorhizobium sp.]RWG07794.1 MAG: ABC transporter permease [Mesorhizobium sp.]RWH02895.1 MAG: ABC transporter permease [Mesorhizobium sp.]TIN47950.1 MAG: ABC transporter permease [Mesorhizobium sp.]TIR95605.1 MAG: ABC transporter permease [Mesorhizobium sp.]TIS03403.1 MAG: ABC transporter permease [Mesorhizobium sp.]
MTELLRRYGWSLTLLFLGLTGFWLLIIVAFPYFTLFEHSFRPYLPANEIGGAKDVYSFSNYATFFKSPIYLTVFWRTVLYSSFVTAISLVVSYPIAYFLAKIARPDKTWQLFLLLSMPMWVSETLRSFAWFIILSYQGPLNAGLMAVHLISAPVRWLTGYNGVIIGLFYTYVLFMLFPIYNAIQALDTNQIEAAQDLGAPAWRIHWRIVIPHSKPGIASGCVMVFMLSAGAIIGPTLLASPSSRWFTEIVQQWMFEAQDWNTGSAFAFLLLLLCTVFVTVMLRLFRVRLADTAR